MNRLLRFNRSYFESTESRNLEEVAFELPSDLNFSPQVRQITKPAPVKLPGILRPTDKEVHDIRS